MLNSLKKHTGFILKIIWMFFVFLIMDIFIIYLLFIFKAPSPLNPDLEEYQNEISDESIGNVPSYNALEKPHTIHRVWELLKEKHIRNNETIEMASNECRTIIFEKGGLVSVYDKDFSNKLYNYKIINDSIINMDLPVLNSNDSLFIYNFRQSQTDTILYITPVNNRKMSYVLYKVKF